MIYVLDTNIISAILKGNKLVRDKVQQAIMQGNEIGINAISYYEIKRGLLTNNATRQMQTFERLCEGSRILLMGSKDVFDTAAGIYAELKRAGKLIKDADILIASIVLSGDFTLVSDDSDFQRVAGLKVENWLQG
ncbi:MAG: type II toxin-antitoxin system VapC family toxin [Chthonomonadetes bacterium]|jgi:tRNA(fMet)-specific endonuclease VapC|nr:type II toxin-antitoxin system VapC family toxin [Chthonomonadetes bacterium]